LTAMGSMVEVAAKEQQRQSGSDRKSDKAKSVEPLSAKPIHVAAEVLPGATSLNDAYRQVRSKPVQNHL
jgi:hypothetical protein